jgi:hypothetical protein
MLSLDYNSKLGELSYAPNGSLKAPEIITGELVKGQAKFSTQAN